MYTNSSHRRRFLKLGKNVHKQRVQAQIPEIKTECTQTAGTDADS